MAVTGKILEQGHYFHQRFLCSALNLLLSPIVIFRVLEELKTPQAMLDSLTRQAELVTWESRAACALKLASPLVTPAFSPTPGDRRHTILAHQTVG